jgi:xanthine dehydrogenase accessory factor
MSGTAKSLRAFLDASPLAALVEVAEAKGSTPREKGAWMLVSPEKIFGTIGGGQLEFMAIDRAREMLGAQSSPLGGGGGSARQGSKRNPAEGGTPHPHPSATPTPSPQGE